MKIEDYPKPEDNASYMVTCINKVTNQSEVYSQKTKDEALKLYKGLLACGHLFVCIAQECQVVVTISYDLK